MKTLAVIPLVLVLAAGTPTLARVHHRSNPAPYGHINSGWGPPANWSEIEISHPEGGGN